MIPKTLSASGLDTYERCPADFNASYVLRAPNLSGDAADLGTVCHETLEEWVKSGAYIDSTKGLPDLLGIFDTIYPKYFPDGGMYKDGVSMMENWYARSADVYWLDRKVLSTESKETFQVKARHPDGTPETLNVTYIMDRFDMLDNGIPEVIDYKSFRSPVQPEELRHKIQPRLYGVAAQLKYPEADYVWVTFDLLRFDQVGLRFTKEDNRATYRFIVEQANRILADNPGALDPATGEELPWPLEKLNPFCRYCVRKHECKTLNEHVAVGGPLGIDDPQLAIDMRALAKYKKDAIQAQIDELDAFLFEYLEREDLLEVDTPLTKLKVKSRSQRTIDAERAAKILGPDIMERYGKLGITQIDDILKTEDLTDQQVQQINSMIRKRPGKAYLETKPKSSLEEV